AARGSAVRGVHNLVVPLSFRCIFSFISPSCYLRDGLLTSEVSPNRNYFAALRARVVPRTINSQSRRREPLLTICPCN
ncbi:MAG TPA: hypothetical protein DCQ57_00780, partial [Enterobacteriaceae bacterium]|nr:hypothetical protein [Enterobacteriaceae bacterium]